MNESKQREQIAYFGKSLFDRGLTFGSSGNISVKIEDGWLMTPTNCCLGNLDPARITKLDHNGNVLEGDPPTKERMLHIAMYDRRDDAGAVVHLHSTYSVAVSCLKNIDPENVLPPITAYYVMRVGKLLLLPYYAPGDPTLADAVREVADRHHAVLLANHGPVIAGTSLDNAVYATEELEETAKLYLLLQNKDTSFLTSKQVSDLEARFKR